MQKVSDLRKPVEESATRMLQRIAGTRLALAEVLAGEDRRHLVLDDILTATDTGRLARILSILEEAAQRLQFFILTCHPERYRGLSEGEFYDLEGILSHKPAQS